MSSSKLATPVHDWSEEELCFFNVSFNRISECHEFFGIDDLPDPAPSIMGPILEYTTMKDWQQHCPHSDKYSSRERNALCFFDGLEQTSHPEALPGFVSTTLSQTSMCGPHTLSHSRRSPALSLVMSGQRMEFHGDHGIVSVLSNTDPRINIPICVTATDFSHATQLPPVTDFDRRMGARVGGHAVATFQMVNAQREERGMPPLLEALIPGVAWFGSSPAFLKVQVTKDLSDAVAAGALPSTSTVVDVYLPPMTHEDKRYFEGMLNLEFRYKTMRCFEAFGKLISQDVYGLLFDSEAYKTMHRLTEDET